MEETVKCPVCGREYAAGKKYCDVCLSPIQRVKGSWDNDEDDVVDGLGDSAISQKQDDCSGSGEETVRCSECGAIGVPGSNCVQCGCLLAPSGLSCREYVVLTLPDNSSSVEVECGREVIIGRESPDECIAKGLERFAGISRRHCAIEVAEDGASVSITDLGSLNGTWVDGRESRLMAHEMIYRAIPLRIRLGSRLFISIE